MITKTQNSHIFQRLASPMAVACASLFACLSQPLMVQAQTIRPTSQLDSMAGGQPITSTSLAFLQTKSMRIEARPIVVDELVEDVNDPADVAPDPLDTLPEEPLAGENDDVVAEGEDANDPEDLVPDDPPEDPLAGENDSIVAEGEELELNNAGAIDGIYQCDYEFGEKILQTYVSVNGMDDGRSIFLIANLAENNMAMWGWGFGQVVDVEGLGYAFVGETDNQLPFELAVVVNEEGQALAEGSVGFDVQGTKILAEISCRSIW